MDLSPGSALSLGRVSSLIMGKQLVDGCGSMITITTVVIRSYRNFAKGNFNINNLDSYTIRQNTYQYKNSKYI